MKRIASVVLVLILLVSACSVSAFADDIDYSSLPRYAFSDLSGLYKADGTNLYNLIGTRASDIFELETMILMGVTGSDSWGQYLEKDDGSVQFLAYDWEDIEFDFEPSGIVGLSVCNCNINSSPQLYDNQTQQMVENEADYSFENVKIDLYIGRYVSDREYKRAITQIVIHFPAEEGIYDKAVEWLTSEYGMEPLSTKESGHGTTVQGDHYAEVTGYEYASQSEGLSCSRLSQWIVRELENDHGSVLIDCSEITDETGAVADCSVRLTWMEI